VRIARGEFALRTNARDELGRVGGLTAREVQLQRERIAPLQRVVDFEDVCERQRERRDPNQRQERRQPPRDSIRLELPGGGGFGDPRERDADQVAADVADGLITRAAAERDYGVAVSADGGVDRGATARLRGAAAAE